MVGYEWAEGFMHDRFLQESWRAYCRSQDLRRAAVACCDGGGDLFGKPRIKEVRTIDGA